MAKKHKHPEHENLERWLVSYSDFITLLFATFVVLYALSQIDVAEFTKLEESLKQAFSPPNILQGNISVLDNIGASPMTAGTSGDALINSLVMEYVSPKYEQDSFEQIKSTLDKMQENNVVKDIEVTISDRGLVIRMENANLLFAPGSAELSRDSKNKLDKIAAVIGQKFMMHVIRIEGHTDSEPLIGNRIYPTNWELSSARACSIVRYFIDRFKFLPELFTPIGFADTRPISDNKTAKNRADNRRVEIIVMRNKFKTLENVSDTILKMDKSQQEALRLEQLKMIDAVIGMSDAAQNLRETSRDKETKVIILDEKIQNANIQNLDDGEYLKEAARIQNSSQKDVKKIIETKP